MKKVTGCVVAVLLIIGFVQAQKTNLVGTTWILKYTTGKANSNDYQEYAKITFKQEGKVEFDNGETGTWTFVRNKLTIQNDSDSDLVRYVEATITGNTGSGNAVLGMTTTVPYWIRLAKQVPLMITQSPSPTPRIGPRPPMPSAMQPVYDGRMDPNPAAPSTAEVQLIIRYALPKARQAWNSDQYCTEGFEAIDATSGSFTKPNSTQRAVLYRFCVKGHDIANNGIAIIESGRIVAHVVYEGGEESSLQSLPDFNGDGLSEIVTWDSSGHFGYANAVATVIAVSPSGVKNFGIADIYQDDCGAKPERCKTLAYKITVKPGATPVFYRETYRKTKGRWIQVGVAVRYSLRKNTGVFRLLN